MHAHIFKLLYVPLVYVLVRQISKHVDFIASIALTQLLRSEDNSPDQWTTPPIRGQYLNQTMCSMGAWMGVNRIAN